MAESVKERCNALANGADGDQGVGSLRGETRRTDTNAYVDLTHIHVQAHGDLA